MRYVDNTGRIFYPHDMWEDAENGLYCRQQSTESRLKKCIDILSDQELFWDVMCQMKIDWPCSFEYNLSNKTHNRKAWLGQAACCYNSGVSFNVTIDAWNVLHPETQKEANNTAQEMINLFERETYGKDLFRKERIGFCDRTYSMDF